MKLHCAICIKEEKEGNTVATTKRILIVHGEERIRKLLRSYLEREHVEVDETGLRHEAFEKVANMNYNIILLDVQLPDGDGFELCKHVQEKTSTPFVILTAEGTEEMRVQGLEMGADDYIVKPFSPTEVILRLKAILKRREPQGHPYSTAQTDNILQFPDLIINLDAHQVLVNHQEVSLTMKEYDLLVCLAVSPGIVQSREALLKKVWGYHNPGDGLRTIDSHIKRLRGKLQAASENAAAMIITVWGAGYKLETGDSK